MTAPGPHRGLAWASHAAALGLLAVLAAFAWAGLRAGPAWPQGAGAAAGLLAWAAGLHGVLLIVAALTRGERTSPRLRYLLGLGLLVLSAGTLVFYFTPNRVGPIDAKWYSQVMTDFLTQARAGTFPVLTGATEYAFNGAVHPFRSAPWQFLLARGLDLATGGALMPIALQHLSAIVSFFAAVALLYVGLARSRPEAPWTAFLFAVVYATTPSFTVSFIQHDMYMTLVAAPAMVVLLLCVQRIVDRDSFLAYGWAGVSAAALWYCHPPMALLTGMVAAFCVVLHLAVAGPTPRRAAGSVLALSVFAALALPQFRSMAEISLANPDPLPDILVPALALALLAFGAGGLLRSASPFWLIPLPLAWLCLREFKPSLVPAGLLFSGAACALAAVRDRVPRLRARQEAALWVIAIGVGSALAAAVFFPGTSLPDLRWVADYVTGSAARWREFFVPIRTDAVVDQPGLLAWLLLALAIALAGFTRSAFARWGALAAFVLVCGLGILGRLSYFLWLNCPLEFIDVFAVAYSLRLLPVLAPLTAAVGFYWHAGIRERHPRLASGVLLAIVAILPWTLVEHARMIQVSKIYRADAASTASRLRSENIVLERYSWDLLVTPRFFSNGPMDPALETRFWRFGDPGHAVLDPDAIARALEAPGQRPLALVPTQLPTGPEWLSLAPRIELDPGQKVLVRFDFLGKRDAAWLIVRGQTIYREYVLPTSGTAWSFGEDALNEHTFSLGNSGTTHESVELLVYRVGPDRNAPPGPGPYYLAYVTPFEPNRAPIELLSLMPLRLRVEAPCDGYLETFRSFIPGYKATVDGRPAVVRVSGNRLVSVWLTKGTHDVRVRFAGTVSLHTDERWAFAVWPVAGLAALIQVGAACRRGKPPA